ncbi:MAG: SpoIIE family protein phosphatase [Azospirillum sp.]|nr:SpoIIE family protein phosphatase [Azospirillum sp.]
MTISLDDSRVLIVDDNEFNRKSLALVIRRSGIGTIDFAVDGLDGLAKVESFRPDLVLLDVDMPNMDGLEMCRQLRRNASHAELPILFQTALDSDEEQVSCFEAGGSDFISKPIKPGECVARVRHQLERRRLFNDLNTFHQRVEKELRHAQAMQLSLLPEPRRVAEIGARFGLELHSFFETSSELGGDLWTVFELDCDRLGILLVDFAGHGITAAINTFRLHTLIERAPPQGNDPAGWLAVLNAALKEVLPVGQFATAFYCVVDRAADTLTFAGAGAPNPVLGGNGPLVLLDSSGYLLGMSRRAVYGNTVLPFPAGSFLLLYSDALTEGRGADDRQLGQGWLLDRLAEAIAQDHPRPTVAIVEAFFAAVPRPVSDDLTLVWLKRG